MSQFKKVLSFVLVLAMLFTFMPVDLVSAQSLGAATEKTEITNIKEQNGKQIIELARTRGERNVSRKTGATLFRAGDPASNETVEQKINITLTTTGLGNAAFDWTSVGPQEQFKATIVVTDIDNPNNKYTKDVVFSKTKTEENITMTLPKNIGTRITAEIPIFEQNIDLRAYKDADGTTESTGTDLKFDFSIMQLAHPVVNLVVVDPYGNNQN